MSLSSSPSVEPSAHVRHTVQDVAASGRPPLERAEALVEVAFDLQKKPKTPQELIDAIYLYEESMRLADGDPLARARALAGKGGALRRMPSMDLGPLEAARSCFDEALPVLRDMGDAEELAEVEMTQGLVLQALAAHGKVPLDHAVKSYHRALRHFGKEDYPREFATIHNNLATAYLSMKLAPEKEVMREALAVQSFMEALKVVTLDEDPVEYGMLQNNLGNALQAMRTAHPIENLMRAVEAYDEALKVRSAHDTPVEHANTLANKANALMNLPDDVEQPELGNPRNLAQAVELLLGAEAAFTSAGISDRAGVVKALADELSQELKVIQGQA